MLVAIGCASSRVGFRLGNLHHFWDTERVARLGVPLEAAEGGKGPEAVSIRLI